MCSCAASIIAEYSDARSDKKTHKICFPNNQQITFDQQKRGELWRDYCKIVDNNERNEHPEPLYFAELIPRNHPTQLVVSLDLKFGPEQDVSEVYDEIFLLHLIKSFQDSITRNLTISNAGTECICALLDSKDNYVNSAIGTTSVLLELRFPKCRIDLETYQKVIAPAAIINLRNCKAISCLTHQPINDWNDIIVYHDSVMMYGSSRDQYQPTLELRNFYKYVIDPNEVDKYNCDISNLGNFLPANLHSDVTSELADESLFEHEPATNLKWWLPMVLSIHYGNNITLRNQKNEKLAKSTTRQSHQPYQGRRQGGKKVDDDPKALADIFISLLGSHRAHKDSFWMDVGKALYNVHHGEERGLAQWKRFSRVRGEESGYQCDYHWYTFSTENYIDHRTLAFYAREDNSAGYDTWHKNWYLPFIVKALGANHLDVAKLFYRIFWLDINFVPGTGGRGAASGTWYVFKDHRWTKSPSGSHIRILATDEFIERIEEYWYATTRQREKSTDEINKTNLATTIEYCKKLIDKLKYNGFLCSYLNMVADRFVKADPEFVSKLDQNELLTGVRNGVMEIIGDKCVYRFGKPQDYVSVASKVAYPVGCTMDHPAVKDLMKWYRQSFVDDEVRRYQIKADASCLRGNNSDKIFMSWLGGADNSKSMWKKLKDAVFGYLSADVPLSVLIGGHKKSSGPSPELAQLATARVAFLCEPDDGVEFKNGILKMLTGGDSFFARMCGQDGGKTLAKFKLYLVANQIPSFSNCDKAIKERFVIVPFSSTWVKSGAPESEEEQMRLRIFPQDKFFERKIPAMAAAALWLWAEKYEEYSIEGLAPPPIIVQHTQNYWDENDIYQVFINERVEGVYMDSARSKINQNSKITVTDLYAAFYEWYKECYPGNNSPPDKNTSKKQLSRRLGANPGPDNCWSGVRFKNTGIANLK